MSENPVDVKMPNSLNALWSMMLPGLGQMFKGQIMAGIIWSAATASGYFAFFWPGLLIHALCIIDAAVNRGSQSWIGVESWPQRFGLLALVVTLLFYIYYRNI